MAALSAALLSLLLLSTLVVPSKHTTSPILKAFRQWWTSNKACSPEIDSCVTLSTFSPAAAVAAADFGGGHLLGRVCGAGEQLGSNNTFFSCTVAPAMGCFDRSNLILARLGFFVLLIPRQFQTPQNHPNIAKGMTHSLCIMPSAAETTKHLRAEQLPPQREERRGRKGDSTSTAQDDDAQEREKEKGQITPLVGPVRSSVAKQEY